MMFVYNRITKVRENPIWGKCIDYCIFVVSVMSLFFHDPYSININNHIYSTVRTVKYLLPQIYMIVIN